MTNAITYGDGEPALDRVRGRTVPRRAATWESSGDQNTLYVSNVHLKLYFDVQYIGALFDGRQIRFSRLLKRANQRYPRRSQCN